MPNLLFEVGTEELPPGLIDNITKQIKENIVKELAKNNIQLNNNQIKTYSTPRRIAIYISELPKKQEVKEVEIKGPDKNKAFDKEGQPTPAAIGFAKKHNLNPTDLIIKNLNGVEYVFAATKTGGKEIKEILSTILPESLKNTTGDKFMKWGNHDERFTRPIRWIVAITDKETIDFTYTGIQSSNLSYGHRFLSSKKIKIDTGKYAEILKKEFVIADREERRNLIEELLKTEAKNAGGNLSKGYESLLNTVTNITEYPSSLICSFDKEFLSLPEIITETVLEKHQKYFVLKDTQSKKLLPYFIVITNGIEKANKNATSHIKKGNEKVARARLNDAKFFFEEDLKRPFTYEERIKDLSKVTFQKGLGTMEEKVQRIIEMVKYLYKELSSSLKLESTLDEVINTARLCKLDLTSHMVFEFTELQGEIGAILASKNKISENISKGIFEHYYPRFFGDIIPTTHTGLIVGLADKLDNIISLFSIGKIPSGSADPFALRRQAQAVIDHILQLKLKVNLINIINPLIQNKEDLFKSINDFLIQRFTTAMENVGYTTDLVESVISIQNPLSDITNAKENIEKALKLSRNKEFLTAAKRLVRIVEQSSNGTIDTTQLTTTYEKDLFKHFENISKKEYKSFDDLMNDFISLTTPINLFFDNVLVNDPDPKIKQSRQALLKKGKDIFEKICDFNKIQERN